MPLQGGLGRLIEELAGEALNSHLRNVRSHGQLRRRIADGELSEREVNEAYSRYARENASAYRKAAADLTIRYYEELSELGARYSHDFYREVLASGADDDPQPPRAHPPARAEPSGDGAVERVAIELHGRSGHEIVARFTVENTDPTPTTVEFNFELCRAPHGESFHAPITVQPTRLELAPGANADVLLRVALMPSVFLPGLIYHQPIHAVGGKPLTLDVTLWVELEDDLPASTPVVDVSGPTAAPPAKAPARRRSANADGRAPAPKNSATEASVEKQPTPTKVAKAGTSRAGSARQRPGEH
ncbi:hypothetical protein AB0H36_40230 [Kribbella sp. NPDC050820]|uniref:hypothetical protein n=1 Tax=Kribbella sp. NPDC050820 TaxID=3155408 RepID=UPI0033C3BB89